MAYVLASKPLEATLTIPKGAAFTPEEFSKCVADPVYFIDAYCYTYDPRTAPYKFPFKLYEFQKDYILGLWKSIEAGENVLTEKSRDMGASWCVMGLTLWYWLFVPGSQILLGSRKEDYVDNGTVESLFGKVDYMMRELPFAPEGYVPSVNRTRLKMVNPMNGNVIKGESANSEFARGGRYKFIVPDEMAFWETASTAWAAMSESTRCILPITTPPKRSNFVTYLRKSGLIRVVTLHWRQHPLKDEAWYAKAKERMTPEDVAREIDINWEGAITGRVYPEADRCRVGDFPYMPNWPLYVSHDPGRKDPHALGWFQVNPENGRVRIVESFEKANRTVDWLVPLFGLPMQAGQTYTTEELQLIDKVGQWKQATHFGDPYGGNENQVTGTSVYDEFRTKYDIHVNTNTKANSLDARIAATVKLLFDGLDVNDTPDNRYFMECLKNARYPERSENSQSTSENAKPIHDWTSHKRTMLEFFAVNFRWDPRAHDPTVNSFDQALASLRASRNPRKFIG